MDQRRECNDVHRGRSDVGERLLRLVATRWFSGQGKGNRAEFGSTGKRQETASLSSRSGATRDCPEQKQPEKTTNRPIGVSSKSQSDCKYFVSSGKI